MASSSDEAEFAEDEEEAFQNGHVGNDSGEEEFSTGRKRRASTQKVNYNDDIMDDDDFDDDEIPLSELRESPRKSKQARNSSTKESSASKKKTAKSKAPPPSPKKSSGSAASNNTTSYDSASSCLYESDCTKGLLIQRLLCRWWYSIAWPDPSTIPETPPQNYDTLDGFPGVFVCTSGDKVGHILDVRDNENRPSFVNFARKSSKELQQLLIQALEKQRELLIETEGTGTSTESEIKEMLKWAKKVKPDKADKEAVKVLKASKMKLS